MSKANQNLWRVVLLRYSEEKALLMHLPIKYRYLSFFSLSLPSQLCDMVWNWKLEVRMRTFSFFFFDGEN